MSNKVANHLKLQFLIVMSICTNCALLVWLYDQEGKWKIEPGLAAILVMEHVLLLLKFGFSRLVPEVKFNDPTLTFSSLLYEKCKRTALLAIPDNQTKRY